MTDDRKPWIDDLDVPVEVVKPGAEPTPVAADDSEDADHQD